MTKNLAAMEDPERPRYITERDVAAMTGLSTKCLQSWRFARKGIPFVKLGSAVRYSVADVVKFIELNKVEVER